MPYVREADVENPAIAKIGARKHNKLADGDEGDQSRCNCKFLKAGWFWACVVVITVICVVAPIGVKTTKRLNDPVTDPPKYRFYNGTGLNTTIPGEYDASWGLDGNKTLTCKLVAADLPTVRAPTGAPPPALKLQGEKLVTVDGNKPVEIHGINWFGFNNGKTMVDGLDGEKVASWEGGDFATIVYQLKLLGFNAVRLPFLFNDLLSLPPQDYSKQCPEQVPSTADLAARTTNPDAPKQNKPVPYKFLTPEGFTAGTCNAYVPNGPSTLSRYLWVVQYLVANGMYVLVDYHPHGAYLEPGVLESVQNYVNSWLRVWMSLKCLPNWEKDLKGRVFLDLLNEPDGVQLFWDGSDSHKPLSEYYLAVMDAIDSQAPGQAIFFIQGGGQDKLGTSWGDGFATDKKWIQERKMADANGFFTALSSKPYRDQVVLSPHLYGVTVTKSPDVGPKQWEKYGVSWGYLQKTGYCTAAKTCQKYPVVAGEIGTSFKDPLDVDYYNDMAKFLTKVPPTDEYPSVKFNNWFWWAYNANSGDTGGIVADDWQTLQWDKLQWLQDKLGLKPW